MPSPTTETNAASTTTATSTSAAAADSTTTSLETDLLTHLASTSALDDIHTNLLCYLQRMGWTEKIRTLSLELLRAGRCERFDEVVDAVIASAECRPHPAFDLSSQDPATNGHGQAKGAAKNGSGGNANNTGGANGGATTSTGKNGNGSSSSSSGMGLSADAEAYLENVDVRIPTVVVEHGVRMVKDVLKDVVSWEDGSSLDDGLDQNTGGGGGGQATTSKGTVTGTAGSTTSGKKLDKDKDKDKDDAGDSAKKNGDVSSAVKKTAKKSNPGKTGK